MNPVLSIRKEADGTWKGWLDVDDWACWGSLEDVLHEASHYLSVTNRLVPIIEFDDGRNFLDLLTT